MVPLLTPKIEPTVEEVDDDEDTSESELSDVAGRDADRRQRGRLLPLVLYMFYLRLRYIN